MSGFPARWSLCGGWAVDAWLGRQTRDHGDVDVSVFADDQRALFEHLTGWKLIAHDSSVPDDTTDLWDGRHLPHPAHIHASLDPDAFKLEIIIDERSGNEWVMRREPRVELPLEESAGVSAWGLLTAAPEVILFYKATAYWGEEGLWKRPQDDADFAELLPILSQVQR